MANPPDNCNEPTSPMGSPASSQPNTYPSLATKISDVPPSIVALFVRMADCYGNRWTSQFQPDEDTTVRVLKTWAHYLAGVPETRIAKAMNTMIVRHPSWPPTPGEFLQLANGEGDVLRNARTVYQPALPKPPMTDEANAVVKALLEKTRAAMDVAQDDGLEF